MPVPRGRRMDQSSKPKYEKPSLIAFDLLPVMSQQQCNPVGSVPVVGSACTGIWPKASVKRDRSRAVPSVTGDRVPGGSARVGVCRAEDATEEPHPISTRSLPAGIPDHAAGGGLGGLQSQIRKLGEEAGKR